MKSVLVGKTNNTKVYYVLDADSTKDDGVIVEQNGEIKVVNFWNFINKKSDIKKMQHSEFHKFLWSEPGYKEKTKWQSVFITKTLPIDNHLIDSIIINSDILNRKKAIGQIANRALDFKIALSSQTLEEKTIRKLGQRIGRAIMPNRRIGKRVLREIEGELDPRKRRDYDGDGMIFDGTRREMPAPSRGLRSSTEPKLNNTNINIGLVDDKPRPTAPNGVRVTNIYGKQKQRFLELINTITANAGKFEIYEWYQNNLKGISINAVLKNNKNKQKKILELLAVKEITTAGDARKIIAAFYDAVTPQTAYRRRDSAEKRPLTFFEFLWYEQDGRRRAEDSKLSESEYALLMVHLETIGHNPSVLDKSIHYVSATLPYTVSKEYAKRFLDKLTSSSPDILVSDIENMMPDFLKDQVHSIKTNIVPVFGRDPSTRELAVVNMVSLDDLRNNLAQYNNIMQNLAVDVREVDALKKMLTGIINDTIFEGTAGKDILGFVAENIDPGVMRVDSDLLPVADSQGVFATPSKKRFLVMHRNPESDKTIAKIAGTDKGSSLSDIYFSMSTISDRILIARQLAELTDVKTKNDLLDQISKLEKQGEKLKDSLLEPSSNPDFLSLQEKLMALEKDLVQASVLTDELSEDIKTQLALINSNTTNQHESGHLLHGIAKYDDMMRTLNEERRKRIIELRSKINLTPEEGKELRILSNPSIDDSMLRGWLVKHQHLRGPDEEIIARLDDTETELTILGLTQMFANISTPLGVDINAADTKLQDVVIKNSVLGLLISALKKNKLNRNPGIRDQAEKQLAEITEIHNHKLNELIIDPDTNLPVQLSQSTIETIEKRRKSAIKFLDKNLNTNPDYQDVIGRLRILKIQEGDLTLGNLLKIVAIEQMIGQFGIGKQTMMSSPGRSEYYSDGLTLGTDTTDMLPTTGGVYQGPALGTDTRSANEALMYNLHLSQMLPTLAKYGLPKFFNEEDNKSFLRSVRSYALSHLGHYADAVNNSGMIVTNGPSLGSVRDTFKTLKSTFTRLTANVPGGNRETKNHTVSSYLNAMPSLGMSNVAELIKANPQIEAKSKKGNFPDFYKLLDDDEKIQFRNAVYADSLNQAFKQHAFETTLQYMSGQDPLTLGRFMNVYATSPVHFASVSPQQIDNINKAVYGVLAEVSSPNSSMSLNAAINEIASRVGAIVGNAPNTVFALPDGAKEWAAEVFRITNVNGLTLKKLALHDTNYTWDSLSDTEIDTILKMVQRWGNEFGEPSYAMHNYKDVTLGARVAMARLMTLGKRFEWPEIPAEMNLILESGIPFLTDGKNLTDDEVAAIAKLFKWLRPNQKILPEIKSTHVLMEHKWLI